MSNNNEELWPLAGILCLGLACFYLCCKKIKSLKDEIDNVVREQVINEEVELLVNRRQVVNQLVPPPYKINDEPPVYQV
jgi:hypothetical protein